MICRLCLSNITTKPAVQLLKTTKNNTEVIFKTIAKYFKINILNDDLISTSICEDCCNKLLEFEDWRLYIKQKQKTLHEFVELKCDSSPNHESEKDNSFSGDSSTENYLHPLKELIYPKEETDNSDVNCNETNCSAAMSDEDKKDDEIMMNNKMYENINYAALEMKYLKEENSQDNLDINTDFEQGDEIPLLDFVFNKRKFITANTKEKKYTVSKSKRRKKVLCSNSIDQKQSKIEIIQNFMQLCCDICKCSIDSYTNLHNHFNAVHQIPAYVKCCNKAYKKLNRLIEHIEWHQNPDKFRCNICNKLMSTKSYLEKHINSHNSSSQPKKKCNICKKEYRGNKCLKTHIKNDDDRKLNCDLCNKCFMTPQRLRRHIDSIHENVCPYICDICGKKYKFKPSFERHMQEHQGIVEPPEQCNICNEWLKNKHSLRLHRFTHVEVDIDCKVCGRKCPSRTALIRHINYAHKIKNLFSCNYCDKTFKEEKNLKEHMAIHMGLQLYSCPHCSKECRSKSNMYVHIKRMHFEDWLKSKKAKSNDPNIKEV